MQLTAIVPTLDEVDRLSTCVQHLRAAGVDDILVTDGGSRDGTVQRALELGCRVVHGRRGRALQCNRAALHTEAEVLWFVHADVRVPSDAGAAILSALAEPTVVGGAFGTRTVNDARPSPLDPLLPLADLRSRYTRLPYGDQGLFVRRRAFERVGGYPLLPVFEDVGLARRLWSVGTLTRLPQKVAVSGRRFLARPVYYTVVMNTWPTLHRLGLSPDLLARLYGRVR